MTTDYSDLLSNVTGGAVAVGVTQAAFGGKEKEAAPEKKSHWREFARRARPFFDKVDHAVTHFDEYAADVAKKLESQANDRARRRMEDARSREAKLIIQAERDREKATIYRNLAQAQSEAREAAEELRKARVSAGHYTMAERLEKAALGSKEPLLQLADSMLTGIDAAARGAGAVYKAVKSEAGDIYGTLERTYYPETRRATPARHATTRRRAAPKRPTIRKREAPVALKRVSARRKTSKRTR